MKNNLCHYLNTFVYYLAFCLLKNCFLWFLKSFLTSSIFHMMFIVLYYVMVRKYFENSVFLFDMIFVNFTKYQSSLNKIEYL